MSYYNDYIELSTSKSGLPTISENGGGLSRRGKCQIIAGRNGERIKPLYEPNRKYFGQDHAIFVACEGMLVAWASYWHGVDNVTIYRIESVIQKDGKYLAKIVEVCGERGGDGNIPPELRDFADAAIGKVHCYHCRCKHWGL